MVIVHGRSEEETHSDLREAVREGFVVLSDGSYEFVHDRIHEAAYSLIRVEDRAKVHLRIGRLLIAAMPADKIAERIFNLVNQFNRGAALISDPNEKQRVAELNLHAGRKAKASTAYAAACIYLSIEKSIYSTARIGRAATTWRSTCGSCARNVSSCAEILRKPKPSSRRCWSGRRRRPTRRQLID